MFGRKRPSKDPLRREALERRKAEDERPWFLADDDGTELDVDAGRSAAMDGTDELGPRA